jgi:hypothetical protein
MSKRNMDQYVPLPSNLTAVLAVKVGSRESSRTTAGDAAFVVETDEPFEVFCRQVVYHVHKVADAYERKEAQKDRLDFDPSGAACDLDIFFKPHVSTPQAKYILLDGTNYKVSVAEAWRVAQQKRVNGGAFKLELFVYLTRASKSTKQTQRATQQRITDMARRVQYIL